MTEIGFNEPFILERVALNRFINLWPSKSRKYMLARVDFDEEGNRSSWRKPSSQVQFELQTCQIFRAGILLIEVDE